MNQFSTRFDQFHSFSGLFVWNFKYSVKLIVLNMDESVMCNNYCITESGTGAMPVSSYLSVTRPFSDLPFISIAF